MVLDKPIIREKWMLSPEKVRRIIKTHYSDQFVDAIIGYIEKCQGHLWIKQGLCNHLGRNIINRQKNVISPISKFGSLKNMMVVDLGCGTGSLTVACALEGGKTIGVDLGRSECQIAKLRAKEDCVEAQFVVADTTRLPFRKETFDICMCVELIEHVAKDKERAVYEAFRITRKQGLIEIETPNKLYIKDNHDTGLYFFNYLPKKIAERYAKLRGRMLPGGLSSYISLFFLRKVLRHCNCRILGDIQGYNINQMKETGYKSWTGRLLVKISRISGIEVLVRLIKYFLPALQLTIRKL